MKTDIRDKPLSERLPKEVFNRIHEDIGQATMCWTEIEKAGIFKSEEALTIAGNLCHFVADLLENKKEGE